MSGHWDIKQSLNEIRTKIEEAKKRRSFDLQYIEPRLVAVGKTKPVELIIEAYEAGQRHFGENYPQELIAKATDKRILENCTEIRWHFIGHLQSNKAAKVAMLPNLYIIETIDSKKIASIISETLMIKNGGDMNVFVQVNTSLEEEKNGVFPDDVLPFCEYIIRECPRLKFCGLMTIGKFGCDTSLGTNPDFLTLIKCKEKVCQKFDLPFDQVELSMGMSADFEQAIELGSSNIRIGSSLFGFRERKVK